MSVSSGSCLCTVKVTPGLIATVSTNTWERPCSRHIGDNRREHLLEDSACLKTAPSTDSAGLPGEAVKMIPDRMSTHVICDSVSSGIICMLVRDRVSRQCPLLASAGICKRGHVGICNFSERPSGSCLCTVSTRPHPLKAALPMRLRPLPALLACGSG